MVWELVAWLLQMCLMVKTFFFPLLTDTQFLLSRLNVEIFLFVQCLRRNCIQLSCHSCKRWGFLTLKRISEHCAPHQEMFTQLWNDFWGILVGSIATELCIFLFLGPGTGECKSEGYGRGEIISDHYGFWDVRLKKIYFVLEVPYTMLDKLGIHI